MDAVIAINILYLNMGINDEYKILGHFITPSINCLVILYCITITELTSLLLINEH